MVLSPFLPARLILTITAITALTCIVPGVFSMAQNRSLTSLALDEQLQLQYRSVMAALDYEGRAALAVASTIAALPSVGPAIASGDRDGLMQMLGGTQAVLQAQGITRRVTKTIGEVRRAAEHTGSAAAYTLGAAGALSQSGAMLTEQLASFLREVRAA